MRTTLNHKTMSWLLLSHFIPCIYVYRYIPVISLLMVNCHAHLVEIYHKMHHQSMVTPSPLIRKKTTILWSETSVHPLLSMVSQAVWYEPGFRKDYIPVDGKHPMISHDNPLEKWYINDISLLFLQQWLISHTSRRS